MSHYRTKRREQKNRRRKHGLRLACSAAHARWLVHSTIANERAIYKAINEVRATRGLPPLVLLEDYGTLAETEFSEVIDRLNANVGLKNPTLPLVVFDYGTMPR